jgi:CubicO group peptidase (beta-lactamase class C family)
LSQYLEDFLVPGGPTYQESNYLTTEPGTYYLYSNYAFAILALVVQNVAGESLEAYTQDAIFAPLGMDNSSWFLANLDTNQIAVPLGYVTNHATGDFPRAVFCKDLNGDDHEDMVAVNRDSDDISVLLNQGDGTFGPAVTYAVQDGPTAIFSADFDGGSGNDLAVTNVYSNSVSILLNNGDGTFSAAVHYAVGGTSPAAIYSCDLDGDTDNDLAVAKGATSYVAILLNNGDGTFQSPVDYATGSSPQSVICIDVDSDTTFDIVTANRNSDNVSVLLNNGDATLQAAVSYAVGDGPFSVTAADFDGDNVVDLATANSDADAISVLINNGNGTFAPATPYPAGDYPWRVVTADFDGDDNGDLAVANWINGEVSLLFNNGDGTFQSPEHYWINYYPSLFASDLDGDNYPDLAVVKAFSDEIGVMRNAGDGTFQYATDGHPGEPLWPTADLRSSATQLAGHLALLPGYGNVHGTQVLDSVTVAQIMTNHFPGVFVEPNVRGFGWISMMFTSGLVWYHTGGLPGCFTGTFVDPVAGNGIVLLSNIWQTYGHVEMVNALWDYSLDIDGDGVLLADDNCPTVSNPGQGDNNGDGIGNACCCVFERGNVNGDLAESVDISDLTTLVNHLFVTFELLPCPNEADISVDSTVDISDLTALVNHLFVTFQPVPEC